MGDPPLDLPHARSEFGSAVTTGRDRGGVDHTVILGRRRRGDPEIGRRPAWRGALPGMGKRLGAGGPVEPGRRTHRTSWQTPAREVQNRTGGIG